MVDQHDRRIGKRIQEEERVMGLVIPDTAKEKPQQIVDTNGKTVRGSRPRARQLRAV
jgi:co-chaperonin GroES (HSP10)